MKLLYLIFGSTFGPPKIVEQEYSREETDYFDYSTMDMDDIRSKSNHLIYKDNPIETSR